MTHSCPTRRCSELFTAEGAQRTGLRTASVARRAGRRVVPYAAVLYDPEGKTYVYTSPTPLTFVRAEVRVDRIEGDLARSEEHTSELQSLMRHSYAVFCLKKHKRQPQHCNTP